MKNICLMSIVSLALSFGSVNAQQTKQLNFMNEQLAEQLYNQTVVLSDPRLVKTQAELLRKQYDALVQSGFTKDQALQLVIAIASRDNNG